MYFARVASTMLSGSAGGASPDDLSQPLADEVLTPDSSRFWPAAAWQPGRAQDSYDKQFVRDWLTSSASRMPRSAAISLPRLRIAMVRSRTRSATGIPLSAATSSNVIGWSCSPIGALVDGVKIGEGSREPSTSPAGRGTPQTEDASRYSARPLPVR